MGTLHLPSAFLLARSGGKWLTWKPTIILRQQLFP